MAQFQHFVRVEFSNFKAFKSYAVDLKHFNILVGPNNAGKSTVLAAFRILSSGLRKASARMPTFGQAPEGRVLGYDVDLSAVSIAEENIFYNYDDREPAKVVFRLSNRCNMTLYFPESGVCRLIPDIEGKYDLTPRTFKARFKSPIGFVPILGPVEHQEPLFEKEAARNALFNYQAARNFRNIWYHYPERFGEFRDMLVKTWPGMDIQRPELDTSHQRPRLHMYCPEDRIPRELFWAGFGFQVWCQMLTHLVQNSDVSLFLIDEPDIYLHSDLQRQLLVILKSLGPDILIATHSTEIISDADPDDLLLVSKERKRAKRIKSSFELDQLFEAVGSNLNPVLTQLAKTRRVVFVEGEDYPTIGKFAQKLGTLSVAYRRGFAVVPVKGFNPERIRSLKAGMEATLGTSVLAAAIFDRDYRCDEECERVKIECESFCQLVVVHHRKEIENFLLVPVALDRALSHRVADRGRRSGKEVPFEPICSELLEEFAQFKRHYVASQRIAELRRFMRTCSSNVPESTLTESALRAFDRDWSDPDLRVASIPGKDAFGSINKSVQDRFGVNLTQSLVIAAMRVDEVAPEMKILVESLELFSEQSPSTTPKMSL